MLGALTIHGLRVRGRAGCQDVERVYPQTFTFELKLSFDVRDAIRHDDIAHAPDYERVARTVRELLAEREWHLLERMAYDVGKALFAESDVLQTLEISVAKDILVETSRISASLTMTRADLDLA